MTPLPTGPAGTDPDAPPPAPEWPPVMTPARAAHVQRALLAITTAVIDSMLGDLATADPSTGDGSLADRTMLRIIRPYMGRIRSIFLGKLADADPAALERLMGAVAVTLEQIIAEAPGEPMDRWRFVWPAGEPTPRLVPDVWTDAGLASSSRGVDTEPIGAV